MRIPISSPSKATSRQPSFVLYLEVISTSPRFIDANTSRRKTIALSSTSLISAGSVMISTGLDCFGFSSLGSFGIFSFAGFSFTGRSLKGFSFGWRGCFSFGSLKGFGSFASFTGAFSFTGSLFGAGFSAFTKGLAGFLFCSSLIASTLTVSTISCISSSSETVLILRALMIAGLLPMPKNPELPSETTSISS